MHRHNALVLLGLLAALSPFVGLPYSVLAFVLPVLGLLVAGTALTMRKGNVAHTEIHDHVETETGY